MKTAIKIGMIILLLAIVFFVGARAVMAIEGDIAPERVGTYEPTVCCEETNSGLYCQDVKEADCKAGVGKWRTACESTSSCKQGYCYDTSEGICLDNVPQKVCTNGTWNEKKPASCNLGCCVLGDQASFVTLVRCKRLSSFYGVLTDFRSDITNEVQCIMTAQADVKGACVFTKEFEKTCKFVKMSECTNDIIGQETTTVSSPGGDLANTDNMVNNNQDSSPQNSSPQNSSPVTGNAILTEQQKKTIESGGVVFVPNKLCSSDELETNCGMTKETTCVPGKEEVYFVDSCGNTANIYDASRINDKMYWSEIVEKKDACNAENGNQNSQTCGNCNYILGGYCRASSAAGTRATYGSNICADLNCEYESKTKMHGESWCLTDKPAMQNSGRNPVGSKYYRIVCQNGEVTSEPCADYRQEVCIEDSIDTSEGKFSQAGCRVNRWQDCTAQTDPIDCMNKDKRDCKWLAGIQYMILGAEGGSSIEGMTAILKDKGKIAGGCVPANPPGLNFWEGSKTLPSPTAVASQSTIGGNVQTANTQTLSPTSGGTILDSAKAVTDSAKSTQTTATTAANLLTGKVIDGMATSTTTTSTTTGTSATEGLTEAGAICAQANAVCPVKYEKGLMGDEWECVEHCECEPGGPLELQRVQLCSALGDCGVNINFVGSPGSKKGYKVSEAKIETDDD